MLAEYRKTRTLETVGEKFGVTRERARQILTKHCASAYEKLRGTKPRLLYKFTCLGCGKVGKCDVKNRMYHDRKCLKLHTKKKHNRRTMRCSSCKRGLPRSHFYPKYGSRGRVSSRCRDCHAKTCNSWAARNPEKVREINKRAIKKWLANPKNRELSRKRGRIYYRKNRDAILKKLRERRKN